MQVRDDTVHVAPQTPPRNACRQSIPPPTNDGGNDEDAECEPGTAIIAHRRTEEGFLQYQVEHKQDEDATLKLWLLLPFRIWIWRRITTPVSTPQIA